MIHHISAFLSCLYFGADVPTAVHAQLTRDALLPGDSVPRWSLSGSTGLRKPAAL